MATEGSAPSDDAVEEAVLQVLQDADLEKTTEFKVRELASQKLGADLNQPAQKKLVRKIVNDYLNARAEAEVKPTEQEEEEVAGNEEGKASKVQDDSDDEEEARPSKFARKPPPPAKRKQTTGDDDDNLICQLSNKRNVSVQKFRGKTLVSIREYYEKDGELRPSAKGISLSVDQWNILKNSVADVESAIAELQ